MVLLVCYDVSDNRARRAAARTLQDYGDRVQRSVFECALTAHEAHHLSERLAEIARRAPGIFSVRCYPIPDRAVERVRVVGGGGVVRDEPFFLV